MLCCPQTQLEAAKEAQFAANIGVGGDLSNLLSEDNPDGVVMIAEDGKITFVNRVGSQLPDVCKAAIASNCLQGLRLEMLIAVCTVAA